MTCLARSGRAKTIVEFGTSFGLSTLHLAAALRDNGGGRLITTEFEPSKIARARDQFRGRRRRRPDRDPPGRRPPDPGPGSARDHRPRPAGRRRRPSISRSWPWWKADCGLAP
ncbi:O-methyltransferase [Caulobacter segnis]